MIVASNRLLFSMRVACPLVALFALAVTGTSIYRDATTIAAINGFLFGVNIVLTWIQWFVFKPHP